MSVMDKIRNLVGKHSDKAKSGIDKASTYVDEKTGGRHSDKIDQARGKAEDFLNENRTDDGSTQPPSSENGGTEGRSGR